MLGWVSFNFTFNDAINCYLSRQFFHSPQTEIAKFLPRIFYPPMLLNRRKWSFNTQFLVHLLLPRTQVLLLVLHGNLIPCPSLFQFFEMKIHGVFFSTIFMTFTFLSHNSAHSTSFLLFFLTFFPHWNRKALKNGVKQRSWERWKIRLNLVPFINLAFLPPLFPMLPSLLALFNIK